MPAPAAATPSSATPSSRRWRRAAASAAARGWLPQHAALRDAAGHAAGLRADVREVATARANTSSTMAGPTRYRARRRQLLPEAAGLRALQPGPRAAAAGAPRLRPARRGAGAGPGAGLQASSTSPPSTSPSAPEAEWTALGEAGWLQRIGTQFHWPNQGYAQLRRLPRRAGLAASARRSGASGATPQAQRLRAEDAARARDHAEALGRLPPLLPGDHRQEMGPQRLPQRALLAAAGRGARRPRGADGGRAGWRAGGRRAEPAGRARRSTAATGAPWWTRPSCISSSATTAPSTSRSSTGCPASRPARRASTRSSAATCRCRPIPRTGSRMPGLSPRGGRFPRPRTPGDAAGDGGAGDALALPAGRRGGRRD